MTHRRARQEVLEALAEFDRACVAFARGMARIDEPADPALREIIRELDGPRPARRASPTLASARVRAFRR